MLEREPVRSDKGVAIRLDPYARKDSGSFYTPQDLVNLIVERTLEPLVEERRHAFEEKARALATDRRPKAQRFAELRPLDPAEAVLDLKVLDPAMGSGHFLVAAVNFLSDAVIEVRASASLFREVENTTADLRGLLDFLCGLHWLTAGVTKRNRAAREAPVIEALKDRASEAYSLWPARRPRLYGKPPSEP